MLRHLSAETMSSSQDRVAQPIFLPLTMARPRRHYIETCRHYIETSARRLQKKQCVQLTDTDRQKEGGRRRERERGDLRVLVQCMLGLYISACLPVSRSRSRSLSLSACLLESVRAGGNTSDDLNGAKLLSYSVGSKTVRRRWPLFLFCAIRRWPH